MRVLGVFSTDQLLGGGEISFSLSLSGLQDAGCEVTALLPEGPLSRYLRERRISYALAPQGTLRRGGSVQFLLRPHPAWMEIVRSVTPDVIHCNAVRSALYGQAVGRAASIPTVFHARTAEKDPPYDHFLLATTRAVICASETVRQRFPAWLAGDKTTIIANPVDPSFLSADSDSPRDMRRDWLGGSSGALIGVVGRLSPAKGQHHIVRAAPAILRDHPTTRFVFIGDEDPSFPGYTSALQASIGSLECASSFIFAGFIRDMASAYRALDIVVFPTASEGFGRIVIEAGAVGKPVVGTDLPVLRELMPADLQKDLLCDPSQFATIISALIGRPSRRAELGQKLQHHVLTNYRLESHVQQLLNLYHGL